MRVSIAMMFGVLVLAACLFPATAAPNPLRSLNLEDGDSTSNSSQQGLVKRSLNLEDGDSTSNSSQQGLVKRSLNLEDGDSNSDGTSNSSQQGLE
ncbi:uncharacterized protein LOC126981519 isoform X2 [Eriocheir sinensis]|uniref:uncharacterized protein LOC126981519 isoform X2 n=1 Tax=Eriocheir sinensis TaxID=95602 RepID=UPI0021C6C68C|nr:uncharacterized protein LOC126981519 isoform X2 [Eriocheir sinensis]